MAKAIETLSIKLEFKDAGTQQIISKLSSSLKGMTNVVKGNTSPAISKLRNEILSVGKASTQSISNFRNQANALRALRDEARVGSATFKKLTEDIKKLDAQMAKSQGSKRRGVGARQATQIAGAVVSGGIFGGPEGALGALGGAALGDVQGAFAGAAIGAQVKGLRDVLSAASDYASQVQKLEIALEGVAGSQDNYTSALQTARQVTEEFNVPALDSVRGITRLTAAVSGAGGPIRDAETTFRNVTAAIKATGGSTEDVKGAITAMVQVFSKGKVSAEELSGQLGERLPGAVTLFAKANDMTLPELQKNLKAGTVGLNELMKFIVELGDTYAGTASKIADSNAEAGARLSVAIQDMQAEVGAALIPIGAQFQEAFAEFIRGITPFLVENLPKLGKLFLGLAKNIDTVAVAAVAALAAFGATKIAAIIAGIGGIGKALVLLKAKLVAVALANPFTALALAVGIFAGKLYSASKEQARLNQLIREGTVSEVNAEISSKQAALDAQIKRRLAIDPTGTGTSRLQGLFQEGGSEYQTEQRLRQELAELKERRRTARYDETQGAALDPSLLKTFDYGDSTADDPDSGSGTKTKSTLGRRIEQAQALESRMQRLNRLAQQDTQLGRILAEQDNKRSALKEKIAKLKKGEVDDELRRATAAAVTAQNEALIAELKEKVSGLSKKATQDFDNALQALKDRVEEEKRYEELLKKGIKPERAKEIIDLEKKKKVSLENLDVLIDEMRIRVASGNALQAEIDLLDELLKKRKEVEETDPEKKTEEGGYKKDKNEFEDFKETFTAGLEDMMDVGPKLAGVALNAIGSMTDGLIEMITTGKANFKEMAAAILKDIAKIMMQAAIAGAVKKLFGLADGGVIQGGRLKPYAKGGVVTAPTFFPMAGGDVGLMGEAGPEAIMPLKRNSDGKLGVSFDESSMRESMSRYSRSAIRPQFNQEASGSDMSVEGAGTAVAAPIDVRYTVERINSIDYVTADQFQTGMRQAANQGAKQGEQQTLKRLQMSGSTRKRLGL
jgi:lambda family phage tail tape measure protein